MTKPIPRHPIYLNRRFNAEIIVLCVRWYVTYKLSYRDLVAIMAERGVSLANWHFRWPLASEIDRGNVAANRTDPVKRAAAPARQIFPEAFRR